MTELPMSDLKTITYRPGAGEYAWTFGGAAPVTQIPRWSSGIR
jgi:hypothetical protein